jgi:REP element-mobilizing transposase RayT
MKARLVAAVAILLALGGAVFAHRLDEYLQATLISVEQDHVHASMRLIPGVAVSSFVLASIDTNGDGVPAHRGDQGRTR